MWAVVSAWFWRQVDWAFARVGLLSVHVKHPHDGFFAQMGGVMGVLTLCRRRGLVPHIVLSGPHYLDRRRGGNFLEYFFEGPHYTRTQRWAIRLLPQRRLVDFNQVAGWSRHDYPTLATSGKLFSRYFLIKDQMLRDVDGYCLEEIPRGHTLGLHLRGTDKFSEASDVDLIEVVRCISWCLERDTAITTIFVASDVEGLPQDIQACFPHIRVAYRETEIRSADGRSIHHGLNTPPYAKGYDAMMNSLLLSRCSVLLKTMSNLSGWSKVFNPDLPTFLMNRPAKAGVAWLGFPEAELVAENAFVPQSEEVGCDQNRPMARVAG